MAKRVLVAEEEPEVERYAEVEAEPYRFIYAVGYMEAANVLAEKDAHFDFLLTDILLKPFLGRDLANRMLGSHPEVKVLFMVKRSARLLRSTGLLPPYAPFLHKPFSRHHLITRLDELGLRGPSWLDLILSQSEETAPS